MSKRSVTIIAAWLIVVLGLVGCTNIIQAETTEESLYDRVEEYSEPEDDDTEASVFPWENDEDAESSTNLVDVKYCDTQVDIGDSRFEYLNTSRSSFVNGAWYDEDEQLMIVDLNGTYYQYCALPKSVWKEFKKADSFGTFYNNSIKGMYSCS